MKKAILCVDDEAIIVLSITQELKSYFEDRFIYETALNAEEGLKIVEDLGRDGIDLILILSDWQMPGMNGDEFLRRIRKQYPDIKTILITGHAPSDALEKIKDDGLADSILLKPWKSADLIQAITEYIGCIE